MTMIPPELATDSLFPSLGGAPGLTVLLLVLCLLLMKDFSSGLATRKARWHSRAVNVALVPLVVVYLLRIVS